MAQKPTAKKQESKKPQPGTAVSTSVKHDLTIVAGNKPPEHIKQGENRGSENVGANDLVVPRLEIVQGSSPAMKPSDPGYIKGAVLGDLVNSVTRKNYGKEVLIVPIHYAMQFLVWKKFSEGGGFFGQFPTMDEAKAKAEAEGGEKASIEAVDTPTHLCLLLDREEGTATEIMVPMSKTKAKVSRQWNSNIRLVGGDRFSNAYKFSTKLEKNKRGQEYYNYVVERVGYVPKSVYEAAEKLYNSVKAGMARTMDTSHMGGGADDDAGDSADSKM